MRLKRIGISFLTAVTVLTASTAVNAETSSPLSFAAEGGWPAFHPNGQYIVMEEDFEDRSYTNTMYDIRTGKLLNKFSTHNNTGKYIFSPEGTYMVSSGDYTVVRDGSSGTFLYDLPYSWARVSYKADQEEIAAFSTGGFVEGDQLVIHNLKTNEVIFEKRYPSQKKMRIAHHPTAPVVAVSHGRDVEIIDYEKDVVVALVSNVFNVSESESYHAIWGMTYSPDGEKLVLISSARPDQMVMLDALNHYGKISLGSAQFKNVSLKGADADYRWVDIGYTPDGQRIYTVNYDGIKFYDDETGVLTNKILSHLSSFDSISFSNDPNFLAIERKIRKDETHQTYVEVKDFPFTSPSGNRIAFEDPYIYLNTGQSTYYGLDYFYEGTKTLLDPRQAAFTSDHPEIVAVDESRRLIAKSEGSTIIRAYYRGYTDILHVHVRDAVPSGIQVDPLYDSSFYIKGTTDPNETVYTWFSGKEYRTISDRSGRFSFLLDKPLTANTRIRAMTYAAGDVETHVLRDTIAPGIPIVSQINDQYDTVAGKAEPLTTLRIQMGATIKSVKSDSTGAYKLQIPGIKAGQRVDIKTQDRAGNLSKVKTVSVVDKTPPIMPKINSLNTGSTKVTGYAERNAAVYITVNSKVYKTIAATNSTYSVIIPKQRKYTKVYVYAVDPAGNRSRTAVTSVQ
jgi:hypothetical protein